MKSLSERFWAKVDASGDCWRWNSARLPNGYGELTTFFGGKRNIVLAHRLSWELANGPIPEGMCVLHRCDVRDCVRPDHLFLGTPADNSADMISKDRHCKGERNGRSKLTEDDVLDILDRLADGISGTRIARHFGVSSSVVSAIKCGHRWSHVGGSRLSETYTNGKPVMEAW